MGRVIAIVSGKGGVGKSLGFEEFVSLANGDTVQIGPYVDNLIEQNQSLVKKIMFKTVDGREEIFEVLQPHSNLLLDTFALNEKQQKLESTERLPVALMRKPAPKELISIHCVSGTVQVTPEHKFMVMRNGLLKKNEAQNINPKEDYLVLFSKKSDTKSDESVTEYEAELLGYLIGDGYFEGYHLHVFCGPNDLVPRIRNAFDKVFGEHKELLTRNVHRISFFKYNKSKQFCEKCGVLIATAAHKEVPHKIFGSDNKIVATFLRALFDCDATSNVNRREVEFDSKSKKLVFQVASLLRTRFGILTQIKKTFKIAKNGKMKEKAEYWRLYISGKNAVQFAQKIGFNSALKQKKLLNQIKNKKQYNTNIDVYPFGKILKKIREDAGISGQILGKKLSCTKQMIYEYEWQRYALSKEKLLKYIKAFEELGVKHEKLEWIKNIIGSNYSFRVVDKIERIPYNYPFVYDFQISDEGGHFTHHSGIILSNTTITAELGLALAKRNQKVCVVDADVAMANLSLLLNMQGSPITLHDVLLGESSIQDAIYDGPRGMKLIPSGLSLENYRRVDAERLSGVIESIASQFDFILLDCPAGIEKGVLAAIAASDEVLLVTMPTSPSIADVLKAKITAQRLNVKITGVIVNFVRHEKGEIKFDDIQKLLELPVFGLIPYDSEVRHSFMQEKIAPVMIRNPGSPAAVAIQKTAAKIAGLSVQIDSEGKKKGFFARLLSIFRRKPRQTQKHKKKEGEKK